MRGRLQYLAVLMLVAGTLAASAAAQGVPAQGVYRLTTAATFQRGCWPPCDCPLLEPVPVRGTLNLVARTDAEEAWASYEVADVNWYFVLNGEEIRVTGSGKYKISYSRPQLQRLELDLTIGTEPLAHFDSGIVPVLPSPGSASSLDVTISKNGFYCFDTVFRVAAQIVPVKELLPYHLVKSEYQHGCWPPCLCPLFMPEPVTGTFALVPLPSSPHGYWWTDYAVVKVDWWIGAATDPGDVHVTGAGLYRIGGHLIPQHRLMLFLSFDGAPAYWFDSQLVSGPTFPFIDITITRNNFYCYDQVFYLHARPLKTDAEVAP